MYKKQGPFFNLAIVIINSALNSSFSLHLFHLAVHLTSRHWPNIEPHNSQSTCESLESDICPFLLGGNMCSLKFFRKFFWRSLQMEEEPSLHETLGILQIPNLPVTFWKIIIPLVPWPVRHKLYYFQKCWNFQKLFLPNQKNIVKENGEYLQIFHLLKWMFQN
jgi:hypothetical protein